MPHPFAVALIGVGAVATSMNAAAGTLLAAIGGLLQAAVFFLDGTDDGSR